MIWNWWIGSAMAATVPSSFSRRRGRRRLVHVAPGHDAGRPHYIDDARGEAKQQEHDQPPRRGPEQAVERPPDGGTDQHSRHELGRQPKPARKPRCIGNRPTAVRFGGVARPVAAEFITETPEPRGKSSLVGRPTRRVVIVARVVGHCYN